MSRREQYVLNDFKHRVAICSMKDVVEAGGQMVLARKDVYHCWARIVHTTKSLYDGSGSSVKQSREVRTHQICIRQRRDIDFTQAAWIYEERLQSGARWFKILEFAEQGELGHYLEMDCRITERGVALQPPADAHVPVLGAVAMPAGVRL